MNEGMNERMNKWMNEWMNKLMNEIEINKRTSFKPTKRTDRQEKIGYPKESAFVLSNCWLVP